MADKARYLEQVADYWKNGRGIEAGRLVFENLPTEAQPGWSARILRLILKDRGIDAARFTEVLRTAEDPRRWNSAHRVFDDIRKEVLTLSKVHREVGLTKEQVALADVLNLSELVAKVTYNATNPDDEFDEDSGWCIAGFLRGCIDLRPDDDEFSRAAWAALVSEP